MPDSVEVAEALRECEARSEERIFRAQDLNHAARPANALAYVRGKALGGEASSLRDVDVGRVPAGHLHAQGGRPISSRAERRSTAHEPQKIEEFQKSLPS